MFFEEASHDIVGGHKICHENWNAGVYIEYYSDIHFSALHKLEDESDYWVVDEQGYICPASVFGRVHDDGWRRYPSNELKNKDIDSISQAFSDLYESVVEMREKYVSEINRLQKELNALREQV